MELGKLENVHFYVDGSLWVGTGEIKLPTVEHYKNEVKNLALMGDLSYPSVKLKAMTSEIKLSTFDPETLAVAMHPRKAPMMYAASNWAKYVHDRGVIENVPVKVKIRGFFSKRDTGNLKFEGSDEISLECDVHYLKFEVDGEELVEIDVVNWVYKIKGDDIISEIRRVLNG